MSGPIAGSKIDLVESSGADLPAVGTTRIIRVGGVTKQSVDGAAYTTLGSGAATGVGWDATQWANIQAVLAAGGGSGQLDDYNWTDLLNPNEYATSAATAAFTADTKSGGVLLSGVGSSSLWPAGQLFTAPASYSVGNMQTEAWAMASRVTLMTATTSGKNTDLLACIATSGGNPQVSVSLYFADSATVCRLYQNTAKNALNAAGTVGVGITLGVAFDVVFVWDALASVATVLINNVLAGTVSGSANMPALSGTLLIDTNLGAGLLKADSMLWAFKRSL